MSLEPAETLSAQVLAEGVPFAVLRHVRTLKTQDMFGERDVLSLVYVSTASRPLSRQAVEDIAERAAVDNRKCGITGLLAYNARNFMQLLEGEHDDVHAVMRRIEDDVRHSSIIYIRRDSRATRECPDWSMCPIFTPLTGAGSVGRFADSLPETMELGTRVLFTSFASSLSLEQA